MLSLYIYSLTFFLKNQNSQQTSARPMLSRDVGASLSCIILGCSVTCDETSLELSSAILYAILFLICDQQY
jgi:hypothetical protein